MHSALNSSWQFWCTKRQMVCFQNIWRTSDDCQLTSTAGRRWLRSSNIATCEVPRTRTSLGNRSFTVAGPRLWDNPLLHLYDSEHTFLEFRRLLKTHLFCWGQRRLVTVCFRAPINLHLHYIWLTWLHLICRLSAHFDTTQQLVEAVQQYEQHTSRD